MSEMATPAPAGRPAPGDRYWDTVLDGWAATPAHQLWRAHSDAVNTQLLRRWLPPHCGRVLKTDLFDEAVGVGLYGVLAAHADEVVGVDLAPSVLAAVTERHPDLEVRLADVLALPFPADSFDVIVSNSTLDHFASHATLRAAVSELVRVLRPRGTLIITLDNRSNPVVAARTSFMFGLLYRLGVVPYYVGATYGSRRLVRVLRASGLDVTATSAFMHCPPQLAAYLAARRSGATEVVDVAEVVVASHLGRVLRWERLARWPTRHLTAHFVGARAVKR